MALSPAQFENTFRSHDYNTGYRIVTHDIEVPDWREHQDRGEPSQVRAQAREYGPNRWNVELTHGPHLERDDSGSYYKRKDHFTVEGPISAVVTKVRKTARDSWKGVLEGRKP